MYTQGVKKKDNFWEGLEKYGWRLVGRSPLPWRWVGIGVVLSMIGMSLINVKNSVAGANNEREVIELAARRGDYKLADTLYRQYSVSGIEYRVLGAGSELEELVYPERVVERRAVELKTKLEDYPGNREIYLELATIYGQLGNGEESEEYREKARVLDPNNVEF